MEVFSKRMLLEQDFLLGASVGLVVSTVGTDLKASELLRRADVAMYNAKEAGRNRLVEYGLPATAAS